MCQKGGRKACLACRSVIVPLLPSDAVVLRGIHIIIGYVFWLQAAGALLGIDIVTDAVTPDGEAGRRTSMSRQQSVSPAVKHDLV